jgi:hypothetical protein
MSAGVRSYLTAAVAGAGVGIVTAASDPAVEEPAEPGLTNSRATRTAQAGGAEADRAGDSARGRTAARSGR